MADKFVRAAAYMGCAMMSLYFVKTFWWEMRVSGYKRRTSSNEGILDDRELKEEEDIKNYLHNHCRQNL